MPLDMINRKEYNTEILRRRNLKPTAPILIHALRIMRGGKSLGPQYHNGTKESRETRIAHFKSSRLARKLRWSSLRMWEK